MAKDDGAPRRSLRERNRELTRRAILQAAQLLMTRDGAGRMSILEVAQFAGVSDTTVFNYFKTKTELLDAAVEDLATATSLAALLATRPASETPFAALRNVVAEGSQSTIAAVEVRNTVRTFVAVRADATLWGSFLRLNYGTAENLAQLFVTRAPSWDLLQARLAAHATVAAMSSLFVEVDEQWTTVEFVQAINGLLNRLERAWPADPTKFGR